MSGSAGWLWQAKTMSAYLETEDPRSWSHVRVATKYPNVTAKYFAARGVQAECIKLNGAMELAPTIGLCRRIVDLVETGSTLKANGLVEVEQIAEISSRLVVNRTAFKQSPELIGGWVDALSGASYILVIRHICRLMIYAHQTYDRIIPKL